jgi:hypothetical protein
VLEGRLELAVQELLYVVHGDWGMGRGRILCLLGWCKSLVIV